MKIKRVITSILFALLTSCASQRLIENPKIDQQRTNLSSDKVYKFGTGEVEESKSKAEEEACNNARIQLAKEISTQIRERSLDTIRFSNEDLEQKISRDLVSLSDLRLQGVETEVYCNRIETKGILGSIRNTYDCSCKASISKESYQRLLERETKKEKINSETVEVEGFKIDRLEITESDFASYLRSIKKEEYKSKCKIGNETIEYLFDPTNEDLIKSRKPMRCITQEDALNYCESLSKDLPTKEEWNIAAGINQNLKYPFGESLGWPTKANFGKIKGLRDETSDVGEYSQDSSPYGALDMGGNVAEWTKTKEKNKYIVKGGAWNLPEKHMEIKNNGLALNPSNSIGFRCVLRP